MLTLTHKAGIPRGKRSIIMQLKIDEGKTGRIV